MGKFPTFFCPLASPRFDVNTELEVAVTEELTALGFDLVEIRMRGSTRRPLYDIRIDRRDGGGVTIADCAKASRAIEKRLEAGVLLDSDFVLEVSSPGLERPLRRVEEWRRFTGHTVSVLSAHLGGRRELQLAAVEGEEGSEEAVLKDRTGKDIRVPLAGVKEARLVFTWKR